MKRHVCRLSRKPFECRKAGKNAGKQSCKCCGIVQEFAWVIANKVWNKSLPKPWVLETLCIDCWCHLSIQHGVIKPGARIKFLDFDICPGLWENDDRLKPFDTDECER